MSNVPLPPDMTVVVTSPNGPNDVNTHDVTDHNVTSHNVPLEGVTTETATTDDANGRINRGFEFSDVNQKENGSTPKWNPTETKNDVKAQDGGSERMASLCSALFGWRSRLSSCSPHCRRLLAKAVGCFALVGFCVYAGFALSRTWGTEAGTRILLGLLVLLWAAVGSKLFRAVSRRAPPCPSIPPRARKVIRWLLYLVAAGGAVVYLALEVAPRSPRNLVALSGMALLILIGLGLSSHPHRVNWHTVFWALSLQFYLAVLVLRTTVGADVLGWLGDRIEQLVHYSYEGSKFLFGEKANMHPFAFQMMPIVLWVNAVIAILYQLGAVQAVVSSLGSVMAAALQTSPVESVSATANIFLGLTEAPLVVRSFLPRATESEIFAIMTGGFASIAGSFTGILIGMGLPARHILAASVMSAPAALGVAKLMCPETEPATKDQDYNVSIGKSVGLLEGLMESSRLGVQIIATVMANLFVFVVLIALVDDSFAWLMAQVGVEDFPLTRLGGYLLYPLMAVMGVDAADLVTLGRVVAVKLLTNILFGYQLLADVQDNSNVFRNFTSSVANATWETRGNDVILHQWNRTLTGGVLTERSVAISVYVLCGFNNVAAVGVCLGTFTALVPARARVVIRHVGWAGIGGIIACFLTASVASLLVEA